MATLSDQQRSILADVVDAVGNLEGVAAVVLGGSYARNRARPDSDLDVGIYYRASKPFSIGEIRRAALALNDASNPVVTGFGEWGPWANGGAWLTITGQRVDLLYRNLDQVHGVLHDARQGHYELHYGQQPPFGFFSPTYLGEVTVAVPLTDPRREIERLKSEVAAYPEPLRASVIENCLWGVEFGLAAFAPKFAASGDSYGVAGCLARFCHYLVLAIFALNRTYLLNDKTALAEIVGFEHAPRDFRERVQLLLGRVGTTPDALQASLTAMRALFEETVLLAGGSYTSSREKP